MMEFLDRRALGAIEFIDAVTSVRMRGGLRLEAVDERLSIATNRSSLYVIRSAPGLEHHLGEFEHPPATPALESLTFEVLVSDPTYRYLPRKVRIKLPRKDAPQSDAQSVLNPVVVPMYPASAAALGASWAVLRARVQSDDGSARGLGNALVIVSPQLAGSMPVTAMTDDRGEALVAVTGVAPVLPGGDAVLTRQFSCDIEVVLDKRVVTVQPPPSAVLADPESILADRAAGDPSIVVNTQPAISLSAGKSLRLTVGITWP